MNHLAHNQDYHIGPSKTVELYEIAHLMKQADLSDEFIANAIKTAMEFEGVADLLKLWRDEDDCEEKDEIIADVQELIEDCAQLSKEQYTYISMNDLPAIAEDIRKFKDALLMIVEENGGITKLSKLTKIPQPSLSRFFSSNAMPRRTTLLKIASVYSIDAVRINTPWAR